MRAAAAGNGPEEAAGNGRAAISGPFTLISNRNSGQRNADRIARLKARIEARLGPVTHLEAGSGDGLLRAARQAADAGSGTVFAAGGDGTLNAVANELKNSGVALAALPMGTFNFFARGLEIPEDPLEAVDALCDGTVEPWSIGEVNGKVFLNNASLGLYPAILKARESVYSRWGRSRLAAYWTVLTTLLRPGHGARLEVETDGVRHALVTPMIFIGSNPYQLRMMQLDGAELPERGRLALYYGPDTGRFGMLRTAIWLAFGQARRGREFGMLSGREIIIHPRRRRRLSVAMDGERSRLLPPLRFRLLEDALLIVRPAGAHDEDAADSGA